MVGLPWGSAIDIFGVGCILAEFRTPAYSSKNAIRRILLYPDTKKPTPLDELLCMRNVLGPLPKDLVQKSQINGRERLCEYQVGCSLLLSANGLSHF